MKVEEQFLTKSKFTKLIESTVADMKLPYMDAILHVCDKNDIETLFGIGGNNKSNSSSWILKKWKE